MKYIAFGLLVALACTLSHAQDPATITLPAGAELILRTPYSYTFTCEARTYGYYADQDNGCQVFHVCVPVTDEQGVTGEILQYSFFCGNQTLFNQERLVCDHPDQVDCSIANSFYSVNDNFGIIPPQV